MKGVPGLWKNRQLRYHVASWLVFILYEMAFVRSIHWATENTSVWSGYIIPYLVNIGHFYFHALVTLTLCFGRTRRRPVLFVCLLLSEMAVYLFLMGAVEGHFLSSTSDGLSSLYPSRVRLIQQAWRGIYFLIFSTAFWLIQRSFQKVQRLKNAETTALLRQQEARELELKLVSAQNAFLQAQINPHLLFNTLNFIHSEVQQAAPKASEAIITLSDMMRYSLTETKTDGKVELEREVEQLENLIRINQFRFNHRLCIQLVAEGDFSRHRIIPLLLVPFVENLFKYAELLDEAHPVRIGVRLQDHVLRFETFNVKRRTVYFRSPGIGIANVKTRLHSYYPDRFTLDIQETPSTFYVHLQIEL